MPIRLKRRLATMLLLAIARMIPRLRRSLVPTNTLILTALVTRPRRLLPTNSATTATRRKQPEEERDDCSERRKPRRAQSVPVNDGFDIELATETLFHDCEQRRVQDRRAGGCCNREERCCGAEDCG